MSHGLGAAVSHWNCGKDVAVRAVDGAMPVTSATQISALSGSFGEQTPLNFVWLTPLYPLVRFLAGKAAQVMAKETKKTQEE